MTEEARQVMDQAIAWHLRLADATVETWHDFTRWLEADAAHADAYDRLALDDALLVPAIDGAVDLPAAANDDPPALRQRRLAIVGGSGLAGVAIAAFLTLQGAGPGLRPPDLYTIATPAGVHRTLRLGDGTQVALNGGTRLTLDRADTRFAALDAGQALFTVRHDAAHPFELQTGGTVLRDIGTKFDVTREGSRLSVEVAEGAVLFQPDHEAVMLRAGAALIAQEDEGRITLTKVAAGDVGSWRGGQLSFRGQPLTAVVARVERATGARISLGNGLATQSFTGSLSVRGGAADVVPRLAGLTGTRWSRTPRGWLLTP
jgi:transmembrane sensor